MPHFSLLRVYRTRISRRGSPCGHPSAGTRIPSYEGPMVLHGNRHSIRGYIKKLGERLRLATPLVLRFKTRKSPCWKGTVPRCNAASLIIVLNSPLLIQRRCTDEYSEALPCISPASTQSKHLVLQTQEGLAPATLHHITTRNRQPLVFSSNTSPSSYQR